MTDQNQPPESGVANAWVLDAVAHDTRTDRVVLAMFETRPWVEGDAQAFQLQEKLNAYVSFILDGEMREAYPEFAGKKVCVQLRTVHPPDVRTLSFIALAREQLELQGIDLETVLIGAAGNDSGCGCGSDSRCCG
jgi:hypothetical protein